MKENLNNTTRVLLSVLGVAIIIIVCFVFNSRLGIIGAAPLVAGISGVCPCKRAAKLIKSNR